MRAAGATFDDELLRQRQARLLRRPRHRHADRPTQPPHVRERREAIGLRPGFAMVDTSAAEFAAETPYFYRPTRRPARRPRRRRSARRQSWSSAPGRCASARASSSTTAPCRPPTPCARSAGRRSWSTRTRRPCRPTSTPRRGCTSSRSMPKASSRSFAPRAPTATPAADALVQFGGQTPLGLRRPLAADGVAPARPGPRGHRPDRGADALRRPGRPTGHPAAGRRHGDVGRGSVRGRRARRLPGHRPAVVRHRWPGRRLRLRPRRTWPRSSSAPSRSTTSGRCASTPISRAWRSTSTPSATAWTCSSRG